MVRNHLKKNNSVSLVMPTKYRKCPQSTSVPNMAIDLYQGPSARWSEQCWYYRRDTWSVDGSCQRHAWIHSPTRQLSRKYRDFTWIAILGNNWPALNLTFDPILFVRVMDPQGWKSYGLAVQWNVNSLKAHDDTLLWPRDYNNLLLELIMLLNLFFALSHMMDLSS